MTSKTDVPYFIHLAANSSGIHQTTADDPEGIRFGRAPSKHYDDMHALITGYRLPDGRSSDDTPTWQGEPHPPPASVSVYQVEALINALGLDPVSSREVFEKIAHALAVANRCPKG